MTWDETRKTLAIIFKEVSYDDTASYELGWERLEVERSRLPPPYMVFMILVIGHTCKYRLRPFEKTLWSINLRFKGVPLRIELGKFGLLLDAPSAAAWSSLTEPFIDVLSKAARVADRGSQGLIAQQLKNGKITIPNRYHIYDHRYEFFRKKAIRAYKTPPQPFPMSSLKARGKRGVSWDAFKPEREGFFYGSASIDSYFSRLEHLLVLLFPFSNSFGAGPDIIPFIAETWRMKFKRIFDLSTDCEAKDLYEALIAAKERFRNSISHGFEKGPSSLLVHYPFGAIPVQLARARDGVHFSMYPMRAASFMEVSDLFERMDRYLREGPTRFGFMYVKSGLDIPCDSDSVKGYRTAMSSMGTFEEFVERQSHINDQNVNMEW